MRCSCHHRSIARNRGACTHCLVLELLRHEGRLRLVAIQGGTGLGERTVTEALALLLKQGRVSAITDDDGTKHWYAVPRRQRRQKPRRATQPEREPQPDAKTWLPISSRLVNEQCSHPVRYPVRAVDGGVFASATGWTAGRVIARHCVSCTGWEADEPVSLPPIALVPRFAEELELPARRLHDACECSVDGLEAVVSESGDVVGYQCRRCLRAVLAPPRSDP